jgi:hypothetical protein
MWEIPVGEWTALGETYRFVRRYRMMTLINMIACRVPFLRHRTDRYQSYRLAQFPYLSKGLLLKNKVIEHKETDDVAGVLSRLSIDQP